MSFQTKETEVEMQLRNDLSRQGNKVFISQNGGGWPMKFHSSVFWFRWILLCIQKKRGGFKKGFCSTWLFNCQHAYYNISEAVIHIYVNQVIHNYDSGYYSSGNFIKGERGSWASGAKNVFGQVLVLCCSLCYIWGGRYCHSPKQPEFRWTLGLIIPWVVKKARVWGSLPGLSQT